MSKRLMGIYEQLVLKNPRISLLLVLAFAVLMAFGLPNFKLDASADSLTLEHDTDLDYFRQINQQYGGGDFVVMTYSPKDMELFSDQSLELLQEIKDQLSGIDGVVSVFSMLDAPLLYSPKIEVSDLSGQLNTLKTPGIDKAQVIDEFHNSPLYRDLLLSPDEKTTALLASFDKDKKYTTLVRERDALKLKRDTEGLTDEQAQRLKMVAKEFLDYRTLKAEESFKRINEIRQLANNYRDRAELILGGPSMITADMVDFIKKDLRTFGAGIIIFIIVLLAVIFRQLRSVILPLATCLLSVEIMLGFLSWVDWRLTVISSNFVALLLIITLALTIHLIVRYREYHREGPDRSQYDLVRDTVAFMARPCFYTVLTTVVAFASLVVSDIRPVIDFGWMMTLGIILAFVLAFIIIPCGMLVLGKAEVVDEQDKSGSLTLKFSRFTERHGVIVLLLSVAATVFSGWGITQLKVENRFIDYFRSDTEIYRGLSIIDAKLGGTTPLDIILDAPRVVEVEIGFDNEADPFGEDDPFGEEEDPFSEDDPFAEDDPFGEDIAGQPDYAKESYWFSGTGIRKLVKLQTYLEGLDELGKVSSLATVYEVASDLMDKQLNDLELALLRKSVNGANSELLIKPYFDAELDQARISIRAKETEGNLKREELLAKIQHFSVTELNLEPEQIHFTGLLVLYNNMLQSLFRSQILTLGAVFIGIMGMFLVLFRSVKLAIVSIIPNMLAALVIIGGMGVAGIPLDMMTITIAAITVGIGVDDTIHYVHRFKTEFAKQSNYISAMHRSHGSIGKAMYYTSVTIVLGFSILAFSEFIPSIYFGLLTGAAMIAALMGALLLLPKLILMVKPFGEEGAVS